MAEFAAKEKISYIVYNIVVNALRDNGTFHGTEIGKIGKQQKDPLHERYSNDDSIFSCRFFFKCKRSFLVYHYTAAISHFFCSLFVKDNSLVYRMVFLSIFAAMMTMAVLVVEFVVNLIGMRHFYISYFVPKIYYLGEHPTKPMQQPDVDFRLDVDVHLDLQLVPGCSSEILPTLILQTDFGNTSKPVPFPFSQKGSTLITFSMIVPKEEVKLWWRNGMGLQPLFIILIGTTDSDQSRYIRKQIVFRITELVTIDDCAKRYYWS
jgi:hypothetical protein